MAPIFRVGLLVVLAVAAKVAAELEYTTAMADSLLDYEAIQKKVKEKTKQVPVLQTQFWNAVETAVQKMGLVVVVGGKGILFYVKKEGDDYKLPGIKTSLLKKRRKPEKKVFYFKEMHFEMLKNRNNKPYMKLTVKFHDNTSKRETIDVAMYLYKPPKGQDHIKQAGEDDVPVIPSPVPPKILSSLVEKKVRPEDQSFLGDIQWIDAVLQHALFEGTKKTNFLSNYLEGYLAGPVIINEVDYDNILKLADSFKGYASS